MTKDTKDYSSLLRMGRVKSLLLMFTMLMIWGTVQSMAQTDSPVTFHNASIGGVSLSWDTDNKGKVITTNDADEAQQWVVEYAEGSTTDFYLKNVGSNTYLTIGTANNWDMTFISSSNLATYADRAKYSLKELTNGNYGINTKHQNKYIGTDKTSHLTRGLSPCDKHFRKELTKDNDKRQDMKTRYGHTESWNYGVTELRSCTQKGRFLLCMK